MPLAVVNIFLEQYSVLMQRKMFH